MILKTDEEIQRFYEIGGMVDEYHLQENQIVPTPAANVPMKKQNIMEDNA